MVEGGPRRADGRAVDAVSRALDAVEDRMGAFIGAEDMARAACYSPFYFSRLFSQATGHSPYDYLMRRRVAAAAEELVEGDRSITELALEYGFDVPDTFARAFRRCFGLAPSEARSRGGYPRAIARTRIGRGLVEAMLEGAISPPASIGLDERDLIGLWQEPGALAARVGDGEKARLSLRELDEEGGILRCFIGSAASGDATPEFPLSRTKLPASRAARFSVESSKGAFEVLREFAYRTWLPLGGRTRPPAFEILELDSASGEVAALILPLD